MEPLAEVLLDLGGDPFSDADLAELAELDHLELRELAHDAHLYLEEMMRAAAAGAARSA